MRMRMNILRSRREKMIMVMMMRRRRKSWGKRGDNDFQ